MANPRYNTQVAQPRGGARVKKAMGGMSNARKDMMSGYYKDDMGMQGGAMYKKGCLLYTSPSPRDGLLSRMPSSA